MTEEIQNEGRVIKYKPPGPTIKRFGKSDAFVRGIMGPIGSGKSVACCIEIARRARMQAPSPDGIRRTRWAVVRNSYPELKSTTMKTWTEWFGGDISGTPPYTWRTKGTKRGDLDIEVIFLALDQPDDAKKVLSLEVTGVWINEAREIPKIIIDGLSGRVGRYPSKNMGGATWSGIIMDTNAPDTGNWWYKACEQDRPQGWEFFKQPSGVSPEAENVENLPPKYYERVMQGKDPDWIKVYVHGDYGFLVEGNPVFPNFRHRFHVSPHILEPMPNIPLILGADFGLTPACSIGQRLPDGRWWIIDEFVTDDCGIIRFSEKLSQYLMEHYPDFDVAHGWGDPSGNNRSQSDMQTAIEIMNKYTNWDWKPAPSNDYDVRFEAVKNALNRVVDGEPGLLISPRATITVKAMAGGYHYKLIKSGHGTQTKSEPEKNEYSHIAEGLQYLLLGGGEGGVVMKRERRERSRGTRIAKGVDFKVFRD